MCILVFGFTLLCTSSRAPGGSLSPLTLSHLPSRHTLPLTEACLMLRRGTSPCSPRTESQSCWPPLLPSSLAPGEQLGSGMLGLCLPPASTVHPVPRAKVTVQSGAPPWILLRCPGEVSTWTLPENVTCIFRAPTSSHAGSFHVCYNLHTFQGCNQSKF